MNNAFIFPGVGLGIVASGALEVLPTFFSAAAHAVAESVTAENLKGRNIVFPPWMSSDRFPLRWPGLWVPKRSGGGVSSDCAYSRYQHNNDQERLNTLIEKNVLESCLPSHHLNGF